MNKETIGYYQSNIKTSRNEDSVYAMKYASQQMLINKLQQENKELHNKIDKVIKRIELLGKFDGKRCTRNFKMMSADFNYLLEILKDSDVDE